MKSRCLRPSHPAYHRYGGRGIKICGRWLNSFANFLADMGERPDGTTLDRFPNKDGDYEQGNCRWATAQQQCRNTAQNHVLEFRGKKQTVREWSEELGLSTNMLYMRLNQYKWPIEKALTTPWMSKAEQLAAMATARKIKCGY